MIRKRKRKMLGTKPQTRSAVSKRPWVCKPYRDHIAQMPCMVCGIDPQGVDPHHIREWFALRTMGRRISDRYVIPLCRTHHSYVHEHSRTIWQKWKINPQRWCEATHAAWIARLYGTKAKSSDVAEVTGR